MRGEVTKQTSMLSLRTPADRVPSDHPLRRVKDLADGALAALSSTFESMYSNVGRPSIPPERLLKGLLLMALYSVRSERLLCEQLDYNLLFRWFLDMEMDEPSPDHSTFSANRERLLEHEVAGRFFGAVVEQARKAKLMSDEHFSVDGTLIDAWASLKSFRPKGEGKQKPPDDPGNPTVNFHGEKRSNETHESKTDPEARLYKKARADKALPAYQGHALIENRNGLVVAAQATQAATVAEREAAIGMVDEAVRPKSQRRPDEKMTLGADTQYQDRKFVEALRRRGIAPHISEYTAGQNMAKNSLTESERSDARRVISQKKRKLIEKVFGWSKADSILRQVKVRGLGRVDWFYRLTIVAYNLVRMRRLIPIPAAA